MQFKSINELEKFDFKDTLVHKFQIMEHTIIGELEAVIVKANNSQNSNCTNSYAGEMSMTLKDAKVQKAIKEGYKYYDANNVLKEEVPDVPLADSELDEVLKNIEGAYMWAVVPVNAEENTTGHFLYQFGFDTDEETTYWLQIEFEQSEMEWNRYLNRVQE